MSMRTSARAQLICSMLLFGTIGIFVRYIPLPSSVIAFARGLIGMVFLLLFLLVRGKRPSRRDIRANLPLLCLAGAALGGNWVLLFEAYRYTTVATATLCYYLAPVFVILASPWVLGERLSAKKLLCVCAALAGMVCVSGAVRNGLPTKAEAAGLLFGVGAAVLYASVVLLNKRVGEISAYDKTLVQLGSSAAVMVPYLLLTGEAAGPAPPLAAAALLVTVGVLHTGVAYALYFGAIRWLNAQTAAIFSYIDPVVAVILSALVLREPLMADTIVGAVLILGSALISELPERSA